MSTSRRTRSASAARPTGRPKADAPAPAALEPIDPATDDMVDSEFADSSADAGAPEAEATSASSRRNAVGGRNSRKMRAQSSATNIPAGKRSARILTPEEQTARGKAIKSFLLLVVCLALFIGAVGAGWYVFLRDNPMVREAQAILSAGETKFKLIETTIKNRQPRLAREAFTEGLKLLAVPSLGNAKEPIDEQDPNLASKRQAYKAVELSKKIHETEVRIEKIERDIKAEINHSQVMAGFSKISGLTEAELVELEKNAGLFLLNPVEPPAGGRDEYVAEYLGMVQEVKSQMNKIEQEQTIRLAAISSDQVKIAHAEVKALVKAEQFKDALDKVASYKDKFMKGEFTQLDTFVNDSVKQAWTSAKAYAESRFIDYQSPGLPKAVGDQALRDARKRLQEVVDRFGIDEYVSQAKAMLEKYPTP
jgi:hypothetical protein